MPTIIIPDKICSHCGGNKWRTEYRKKPTKTNPDNRILRYRCSIQSDERTKRWYNNNPDKTKERVQLRKPDGYYRTPEMKERYRLKSKRESEQLTNNFVKNKILGKSGSLAREMLSFKDIPQELVEIKRKSILLNRQLKNHGNS
jgi:hypothetical protein